MAGFNYQFDARQYSPDQGSGPQHPVGKFRFQVVNTEVKNNSNGKGGHFAVELKSDQGTATARFNLWNENAQAVDIAHKQLSALCHVTGIYQLDMNNEGAALRGAWLVADIIPQPNKEGYTQVGKFYDMNGNEPGKAPAPPAQPQQPAQGGGWQQPQQPAATPQNPPANGWQPQGQTQPQQGGGWQPGPASTPQQVSPPMQSQPQPAWSQAPQGATPPNAPWNGPPR